MNERVRTGLLLDLHFVEDGVECGKASLPVLAERFGPQHCFLERLGLETAEVLAPDDAAAHELCSLQHAYVLGGGGERHLERRRELAEVALAQRELANDRASRRMSQRMEDEVEPRRPVN